MKSLILALLADIACWAALTYILLQLDLNVLAGVAGALGIVYVIAAVMTLNKKVTSLPEEEYYE